MYPLLRDTKYRSVQSSPGRGRPWQKTQLTFDNYSHNVIIIGDYGLSTVGFIVFAFLHTGRFAVQGTRVAREDASTARWI